MKHPTSLQNYAADNCNILKFTCTCSSCIFWIKLIHGDLGGNVIFGKISQKKKKKKKKKKNLTYKFSGSHMSIYILR